MAFVGMGSIVVIARRIINPNGLVTAVIVNKKKGHKPWFMPFLKIGYWIFIIVRL